MAEVIPALTREVLTRMTSGEKRFAQRLKDLLEDDYLCWYDIPIGRKRRYADFVILHPQRGLLFLEVKDWKPSTLKRLNKHTASLLIADRLHEVANPLEQARQYMLETINVLTRDPQLVQEGAFAGKLCMPYGWGVVLTNITRAQMEACTTQEQRDSVLPDHLVIYRDEMLENTDPEEFQQRLWGMFNHCFGARLSVPQIDRVRWHMFPEVRIDVQQHELFGPDLDDLPEFDDEPDELDESDAVEVADDDVAGSRIKKNGGEPGGDLVLSMPARKTSKKLRNRQLLEKLPDIVKILDIQQEQLARSLGAGHRVIHGVAGSGKTLILGYRCELLAHTTSKPILVLCFNITLARKLNAMMASRGLTERVQALHFHDWIGRQLRTYQVSVNYDSGKVWEQQVAAVIRAVDFGQIPRAQYGAVLIDEGHDFEADWLRLVVQMVDPESDSLLLLYDDAQSIYRKKSGMSFSLSSVGIKAQGRTTVLRLNYRNTREILDFSYRFASKYIASHDGDDDHVPLLAPEAAGNHGPLPHLEICQDWLGEMKACANQLLAWREQGLRWNEMAVLYVHGVQGERLGRYLRMEHNLPVNWLGSSTYKKQYNPLADSIAIMPIPSSKGLEFPAVMVMGGGDFDCSDEQINNSARTLYVGLTRAQKYLSVSWSAETELTRRMAEVMAS
ncbi:3'-5' exonuclease [Parathalassolituus penaei]|uniref:NERD domain-containing protein n=1 Tax=Parathalassolituus penaei TaxID=2997323 RepID=A0A9X3IRM7_9GAMM|nr:nuclease-related domain-containing DEAD/DEAH box helicase [Parathalassolituus penaei]MCY0965392.1 NERD domain-containing protein [Parathalassolituus penaei]